MVSKTTNTDSVDKVSEVPAKKRTLEITNRMRSLQGFSWKGGDVQFQPNETKEIVLDSIKNPESFLESLKMYEQTGTLTVKEV